MLYQNKFVLGRDIILIISRYLKCRKSTCNNIANEDVAFNSLNFEKGRHCQECIKMYMDEVEYENWFWRDDHCIRL